MEPVVPILELEAIARAVALDGRLEVVAGRPGSGWFIHAETGVVNADGADLARRHPDYVRGLACHEAAHAATTRYLHMMPLPALKRPGMTSLMNALEDCRIEEWLQVRFPGTAAWIQRYNDRLFPEDAPLLAMQPWFKQFCLGAIHEWWRSELPDSLHDEPRAALEATREARQAAIEAQPPHTAEVDLLEVLAYESCPVRALFRQRDTFAPPDAFERVVRAAAFASYRTTWLEIRPVYEELIQRDLDNKRGMKEAEQCFLQQLGELRFGAPLGGRGKGRRVRVPSHLIPPGMQIPSEFLADGEADGPVEELSELPEDLRRQLEAAVDPEPRSAYERARQEVVPLADRLVQALERVLRPESYPRWVPGFPTGNRVDIRVAMSMEVEPGAYTRMWQRKTLPKKRDPAFFLLLDLSGSMSGEPIDNCFKGTVLLAEVLARLQIPFAVFGFQDKLIPFKEFAAPLDEATRSRMGQMPAEVTGRRRGGHNHPEHNWDGPVLHRAAALLRAYPASTRVMLVVSDGQPSGPGHDASAQLRTAVRQVLSGADLHLVGIGLGPGTEHVREFYPDHLANVPLRAFPERLGRVIGDLVREPSGPAARRAARS